MFQQRIYQCEKLGCEEGGVFSVEIISIMGKWSEPLR